MIGIGTDILRRSRFPDEMLGEDSAFYRRAFTAAEREEARAREDEKLHLAVKFSGKEAVYKSIGNCGIEFIPGDIEILNDQYGKPQAVLHGKTRERVEQIHSAPCHIHISLSYDTEYIIAFAMAEKVQITSM